MKSILRTVFLLCLGTTGLAQAQIATWDIVDSVPINNGTSKLHLRQMRSSLFYINNNLAIPSTRKVPGPSQVKLLVGESINPGSLMYSTDFTMWNGSEIYQGIRDPLLKPYRGQHGNSIGTIVQVYRDDWGNQRFGPSMQLSNLVLYAEVTDANGDTSIIEPSTFYVEGFTYRKEADGAVIFDHDGNPYPPKRVWYITKKALGNSKAVVDYLNLYLQFGKTLSLDASAMSAATVSEKIYQTATVVPQKRSQITICVALIKDLGTPTEVVTYKSSQTLKVSSLTEPVNEAQ